MLDCNITQLLHIHVKKEQFGICSNVDTLLSTALNEMRLDFGCSSTVVCYTPETCEGSTTTSCNIILNQQISSISACDIVLVQTNDIP